MAFENWRSVDSPEQPQVEYDRVIRCTAWANAKDGTSYVYDIFELGVFSGHGKLPAWLRTLHALLRYFSKTVRDPFTETPRVTIEFRLEPKR